MNKENHLVEYKRELSETFERSVIAFLNSTGGHIYIGVNDDGSVYGVKDIDHVQRQVADRILNNIKPNAIGLFEVVTEEKDDKGIVFGSQVFGYVDLDGEEAGDKMAEVLPVEIAVELKHRSIKTQQLDGGSVLAVENKLISVFLPSPG